MQTVYGKGTPTTDIGAGEAWFMDDHRYLIVTDRIGMRQGRMVAVRPPDPIEMAEIAVAVISISDAMRRRAGDTEFDVWAKEVRNAPAVVAAVAVGWDPTAAIEARRQCEVTT